jgi:hypothetical protein
MASYGFPCSSAQHLSAEIAVPEEALIIISSGVPVEFPLYSPPQFLFLALVN